MRPEKQQSQTVLQGTERGLKRNSKSDGKPSENVAQKRHDLIYKDQRVPLAAT